MPAGATVTRLLSAVVSTKLVVADPLTSRRRYFWDPLTLVRYTRRAVTPAPPAWTVTVTTAVSRPPVSVAAVVGVTVPT